jgi:tetratricopeptide (TPR) repeat protein
VLGGKAMKFLVRVVAISLVSAPACAVEIDPARTPPAGATSDVKAPEAPAIPAHVQAALDEFKRADSAADAKRFREADQIADAVAAQYQNSTAEGAYALVTRSIMVKAGIQFAQKRVPEALALLDTAIARLSADTREPDPYLFMEARNLKLLYLFASLRWPPLLEESKTQLELSGSSEDQDDPQIKRFTITAMSLQVMALAGLEDFAQAKESFGGLMKRFGDVDDPDMAAHVIESASILAYFDDEQGDRQSAISYYSIAIKKALAVPDAINDEVLSRLMASKGVALEKLDRDGDALVAYQEAIDKFKTPKEPPVVGQIAKSRYGRAGLLAKVRKVDETIVELRGVLALGRTLNIDTLINDPNYRPILNDPKFLTFVRSAVRR